MAERQIPGGDEQGRRVGAGALLLVAGLLTIVALAAWAGLSIVRCHYAFEWLVRRRECGVDSVLIPALTVPAIAIGAVLAWRSQRWLPFWIGVAATALPLAAFPVAPYGFGEGLADSLEGQVEDAMQRVPYDYRFLPGHSARGYVVFRAEELETGAAIRIAYGGARKDGENCRRPPEVPRRRRPVNKPFAAAGPEPLICFESYPTPQLDTSRKALVGLNMEGGIANALCEEIHGPWACFF